MARQWPPVDTALTNNRLAATLANPTQIQLCFAFQQ